MITQSAIRLQLVSFILILWSSFSGESRHICVAARPPTTNVATGDPAAQLRTSLLPLEQDYDRIIHSEAASQDLQRFQERVAKVHEIAEQVLGSLRARQSASLDSVLGGVAGVSTRKGPSPRLAGRVLAADIYVINLEFFSQEAFSSQISKNNIDFLTRYYETLVRTSEAYIRDLGKIAAAIDPQAAVEISRLCVVLTLLNVSDDRWSAQQLEVFPAWLRERKVLTNLEDFALSMQRPLTAYWFAMGRTDESPQPATQQSSALRNYLVTTSERLVKSRDYRAAAACLRAAIQIAETDGKYSDAAGLRKKNAELLSQLGHTQLAADEMAKVLTRADLIANMGEFAVLRLKYLYESEQYPLLLKEVRSYSVDARYARYLPQLLYLQWVTQRHSKLTADALKTQTDFIKTFPGHPLGAEMHLVVAETALAAGDYAGAGRELNLIERQYPESTLLDKVRVLRSRIPQPKIPP